MEKNWATLAYKFDQMHRFMDSFEALLSMHFLVKCRKLISLTVTTPHKK